MSINKARSWPGMFGSMDCMHYQSKNCPVGWNGQYLDKDGNMSIILEAIADQSQWIWCIFWNCRIQQRHQCFAKMFFGMIFLILGIWQYIIWHKLSTVFQILSTSGWHISKVVNICTIYKRSTRWEKKHFANKQEAARKDVERCFGVLKVTWLILQRPSRLWGLCDIENIVLACCMMHNMIIEDERNHNLSVVLEPVRVENTHRNFNFEEYLQG